MTVADQFKCRFTLAREPTRQARVWRQAIAAASAPFWERWGLHDLRVADEATHRHLLELIAGLDQACASGTPTEIATVGTALQEYWRAVVVVMERLTRANQ